MVVMVVVLIRLTLGRKRECRRRRQKASANIFNTYIMINDDYSSGVVAISAAGDGGNGGKAGGIVSSGGKGNNAGQAGEVEIYTDSQSRIEIIGSHGNGLLAQSVGSRRFLRCQYRYCIDGWARRSWWKCQ